MKKIYIPTIATAAVIIWLLGIYTGYAVYGEKKNIEDIRESENIPNSTLPEAAEAAETENRILPITKITYKYKYPDGSTKAKESEPPALLLGKTLSETTAIMDGWKVERFSEKNVILSKEVNNTGENEYYIVSSYNGFVAAFINDKEEKNLIEVTSTPVASLMPEEREKIENGIILGSRYELSRCIENYGS